MNVQTSRELRTTRPSAQPSRRSRGRHTRTVHTRSTDVSGCEVACVDVAKLADAQHALAAVPGLTRLADTLCALGDATRLRIVIALAAETVEELCVCELASLVGVTQSAVSHSLRVLRDLDVVRPRREGKAVYYALGDDYVTQLVLHSLRHAQHAEA